MNRQAEVKMPLMQVEDLGVTFFTPKGSVRAVRDVSLEINRGEVLGLVGESGCGKSTVAYAMMGYLPGTTRVEGVVSFEGRDITHIPPSEMRRIRGNRISMVYQDPATSLSPSMRVGPQIEEVLHEHLGLNKKEVKVKTVELFKSVGLPEPDLLGRRYPHELSGGMQQRVMIAMALACDPHLLILDEPTTGLDVTTEATVLDLVVDLKHRIDAGILFVSHNLGVIARVADRVAVMYAGQIVEQGPVGVIFKYPSHPYTAGLLSCVPKPPTGGGPTTQIRNIPGSVYSAEGATVEACLFSSRCPMAQEICKGQAPQMYESRDNHLSRCFFWKDVRPEVWGEGEPVVHKSSRDDVNPVLTVESLRHFYGRPRRKYVFFGPQVRPPVRAVVDVSFRVSPGHTLGIVGESGSGKTTIARNVVGLVPRTGGDIELRGVPLSPSVEKRVSEQRAALRMVFQNPTASLNPNRPISHAIIRCLKKFEEVGGNDARKRAAEILQAIGLDHSLLERLPGELSGGQQQRVALAAAFAGNADMIVADEAVSSLDVSVQAQVLNLLTEHQRNSGTAYIFISHDLGVVRYLSDDILVLYAGHLAESGPADSVLKPPSHPYTEALLSAAPQPDPDSTPSHIRLTGAVPTLREAFKGCFFASRCPRKIGPICDNTAPPARSAPNSFNHVIYCHIPVEELMKIQGDTKGTTLHGVP